MLLQSLSGAKPLTHLYILQAKKKSLLCSKVCQERVLLWILPFFLLISYLERSNMLVKFTYSILLLVQRFLVRSKTFLKMIFCSPRHSSHWIRVYFNYPNIFYKSTYIAGFLQFFSGKNNRDNHKMSFKIKIHVSNPQCSQSFVHTKCKEFMNFTSWVVAHHPPTERTKIWLVKNVIAPVLV